MPRALHLRARRAHVRPARPGRANPAALRTARAIQTSTEDGSERYQIDCPDPDTTRLTEPDGSVFLYTFNEDGLNTRIEQVLPNGSSQSLGRREWDADGMLLLDANAAGNSTRYTYDKNGNLITSTNALSHTTHIAYDAALRLIELINGHGERYRFK